MKKEILADADVKKFLVEHAQELSEDVVERSLVKLYEYTQQSKQCKECPSLAACKNILQGYHPHLIISGKTIDLQYERCSQKIFHDQQKKQQSLIRSLYMPRDILEAKQVSLDYNDEGRMNAVNEAEEFVEQYEPGKKMKGLYLFGRFGVGKTYILGVIANELAQRNVSTMLVHVPEFLREMKGSIGDHTLNQKIEAVKQAPILMLDDIGAEAMSSWARDEVLGTILQYRMLENLPTFFTSNFDFKLLEHHLTYTQRGEEEELKAARIMERIRYLAKPVEVKGNNRRQAGE